MRRFTPPALLLALAFVCAGGCGKKKDGPAPDAAGGGGGTEPTPAEAATSARTKLLANLKSSNQNTRRDAIEDLSWEAEVDPNVLPALVELLRDTKGVPKVSGRTFANQINSTSEAAALAIMKCTKGEAVMKAQGLAVLREGLNDKSAAIREHTAYTIGLIGPVAKSLAADVQKLCTDPDANVRGVAFDTLRVIGVADPVALVKLLKSDQEDVVRLTAELIPLTPEMPAEAVAPLTEALTSENSNVRAAAAEGLAAAGPKAAPAAQALVEAVTKSYPAEVDPKTAQFDGSGSAYWRALARIGEPAVAPVAKLLDHTNLFVRALAARTLGDIGPPAKSARDAIKKALGDTIVNVAVEAAVALCRIGEGEQDAIDLIKRAIDAPNGVVAALAIESIPRMGAAGKPLIPLALAKLTDEDPNKRAAALLLVVILPAEDATKVSADVGKLAKDPFKQIRLLTGSVLERLGPAGAPAAEALGRALADEAEEDVRDQFVEALVAMGPAAKPAVPGLLPLVAEKGLPVALRVRAAGALVAADPTSPDVSAALVKATLDDDLSVRSAAIEAIGKLNPLPPAALDTLVKLAKSDPKNGPRVAALRAMVNAGPRAKAANAELDAIATGPQPGLALWAQVARAATDGNLAAASPAIYKGLTDRNIQVRTAAIQALLLLDPKPADLPALQKLMKDINDATRAAAATAAGRFGPDAKDAVSQLRRLLDDRSAEVRVAAADALGRIGPAAKPAITKLKEQLADPTVKLAAQRALNKIEGK
jgi:HEAT repeat protein